MGTMTKEERRLDGKLGEKETVTAAARRAAVKKVASSHSKAVRITEGQRKAIVGSKEYRSGHSPSR